MRDIAFERIAGTARRYYRMSVQPSRQLSLLPGEVGLDLVVVYGRIDVTKRRRVETFPTREAAERRWKQLAAKRRAHDYTEVTHGS